MNIDDPIRAAEALIESDERHTSPATKAIATMLSSAGIPGADKIAGFLDRRREENRDLLLTVLRDELQRMNQRYEDLSKGHQRFLQTDFVELVADGLRKAENIRAKERIVRIGKILATGAEVGQAANLDHTEEMMRVAMDLNDNDVECLRQMNRVPTRFSDGGPGLATVDETNDDWAKHRPRISGLDRSAGQSIALKLQSFGLIENVERRATKAGPEETPFRILRKGTEFISFIRASTAS